MRILFLSTRQAKPSFRFRVEQFLPQFQQAGHDCTVAFLPAGTWGRLRLYQSFRSYDLVVIQKRLLSNWELALARRFARRIVFDFDDAIMFDGSGRNDRRRQQRFRAMVQTADHVIAGNSYLAEQALAHSSRVCVIPTCVNTEQFKPSTAINNQANGRITVGWTGSRSTTRYLNDILPVLADFGDKIQLKLIADTIEDVEVSRLGAVPCEFVAWSPTNEISAAATFDIGIMPLPDDRWTRGKCGFKALQYLALGMPAICSPVGVNCEIIQHRQTGLLAANAAEWALAFAQLIESKQLRETLGKQGRRHVEQNYSVASQGPKLIALLESVAQRQSTGQRVAG